METRVGLPFSSIQAMSAASTFRAVEVLRREINIAALTDKTESMKNIRVVVTDVGAFDVGSSSSPVSPESIYKTMEDWSPSEKVTYGPAFAALSHGAPPPVSRWNTFTGIFKNGQRYGVGRRPADVRVFVDRLVAEVNGDRMGPSLFGVDLGIGKLRIWLRGERIVVGAGGEDSIYYTILKQVANPTLLASTYRIASHLPSFILDVLLNIPHFLISVRNRLLPVEPFVRPNPENPLPPADASRLSTAPSSQCDTSPESNSEADVESNTDSVDSSWISLQGERGGEILNSDKI
jgi:hypothetical protein